MGRTRSARRVKIRSSGLSDHDRRNTQLSPGLPRRECLRALQQVNANAVPFVYRRRAPIASHELGAMARRRRRHQRVVRGATGDPVVDQTQQESPVGRRAQSVRTAGGIAWPGNRAPHLPVPDEAGKAGQLTAVPAPVSRGPGLRSAAAGWCSALQPAPCRAS